LKLKEADGYIVLATTFCTFLPRFFFVFADTLLAERTHHKPMIRDVLEVITAVVVGAVLDLTRFPGNTPQSSHQDW
jgi:hypothetical protein